MFTVGTFFMSLVNQFWVMQVSTESQNRDPVYVWENKDI